MASLVLFAFGVPLLVFVMLSSLGVLGRRVKSRNFGLRDLFILMTVIAVAFGIVAAAIQSFNVSP
jgi:hypothetical protein